MKSRAVQARRDTLWLSTVEPNTSHSFMSFEILHKIRCKVGPEQTRATSFVLGKKHIEISSFVMCVRFVN